MLKRIYNLINLGEPDFIKNKYITDFLAEIASEIKKHASLDKEKIDLLNEKLIEIKKLISKSEHNGNKIIEQLRCLLESADNLKYEILIMLNMLKGDKRLSREELKKFNRCQQKIENLSKKIYSCITGLKKYSEIIPIFVESNNEIDQAIQNINSLEKIFQELNKNITAYSEPKQLVSKQKQIISKEKEGENLSTTIIAWYLVHMAWEKDFKDNFFKTLEIIHRIPHIRFDQGGRVLATIFIEKLKRYKEEVQTEKMLLNQEENLVKINKKNKRYVSNRFQEEKTELDYLDSHINNLISVLEIYGKEKGEFNAMDLQQQTEFNQLLYSFEAFVPLLKKCEDEFSETKLLQDEAFLSKSMSINAVKEELFKKRVLLDKNRQQLKQINEDLQRIFVVGWLSKDPIPVISVAFPVVHVVSGGFFSYSNLSLLQSMDINTTTKMYRR